MSTAEQVDKSVTFSYNVHVFFLSIAISQETWPPTCFEEVPVIDGGVCHYGDDLRGQPRPVVYGVMDLCLCQHQLWLHIEHFKSLLSCMKRNQIMGLVQNYGNYLIL